MNFLCGCPPGARPPGHDVRAGFLRDHMKTSTHGMHGTILVVLILCAACWGCASRQVATCTSPEDNAQVHYVAGMELVQKGDYPVGRQRLERAMYCSATSLRL